MQVKCKIKILKCFCFFFFFVQRVPQFFISNVQDFQTNVNLKSIIYFNFIIFCIVSLSLNFELTFRELKFHVHSNAFLIKYKSANLIEFNRSQTDSNRLARIRYSYLNASRVYNICAIGTRFFRRGRTRRSTYNAARSIPL